MNDNSLEQQIIKMLQVASERDERIIELQRKVDQLLTERETPRIAGPFFAVRWPRRDGSVGGVSIQLVFPLISRMLSYFRRNRTRD